MFNSEATTGKMYLLILHSIPALPQILSVVIRGHVFNVDLIALLNTNRSQT